MKASESLGKILIVDDDPDFRNVVSVILESENYQVINAGNRQEGKESILSEHPDLILLDIMMENVFDGFSLCHDVKVSPEYEKVKKTPIIFVSAVKDKIGSRFSFDAAQQGLRGPDDYVDKPVNPHDLLDRVKKLIKK